MAAIANALQRHQRVHLWIIGRRLPGRDIEGQQGEAVHTAHMLIPPQRDDVDLLPRLEAKADDVGLVDEQHLTLAAHASVAIIQAIDGGVVLIVRAHRLHDQVRQLAASAHALVERHAGSGRILVPTRRLSHGAALRPPGLDRAVAAAQHLVSRHAGLLLEIKQTSMALHFRLAPSLEALCVETLARSFDKTSGLQLLRGKAVIEVKSVGVNKGLAIQAFMNEAPFAGRLPVFAGDDVTDEAGFAVVQRLGGAGIKVGAGTSCALHRCDNPETLRAWLAEALQTPLIHT